MVLARKPASRAVSAEILVRLHSNDIANRVNWLPEISSSATRTIVGVVISLPCSRRTTSATPALLAQPRQRGCNDVSFVCYIHKCDKEQPNQGRAIQCSVLGADGSRGHG